MKDRELLAKCVSEGSDEAFGAIVERHSRMVYAACFRVLGNQSTAEDAAQAAFMVLWRKAGSLSKRAVLSDWLYRTAVLVARNFARAERRRARHEREAAEMRAAELPIRTTEVDEISAGLDSALASLPGRQREAVVLRHLEGLSEAEVATELGCPVATVHTRAQRGMVKLRDKLSRAGFSVSVSIVAGFLGNQQAIEVPSGLNAGISSICTGKALASEAVRSLATEVVRLLFLKKLAVLAGTAVLAIALSGAAVTVVSKLSTGTHNDPSTEFSTFCERLYLAFPADNPNQWKNRRVFRQSYAVRSLAVAYDVSAEARYLDLCKKWADRMLDGQSKMTPPGAYYIGYLRKPGDKDGEWYLTNASSIAAGVLAVAARCENPDNRLRYINSVRTFADMAIEKFVKPSGGIANGYWKATGAEWWCSTSLFGSLCFSLYEQTGDRKYEDVAMNATDWLLRFDYRDAKMPSGSGDDTPSTAFYMSEIFSTGIPHYRGERRRKVLERHGDLMRYATEGYGRSRDSKTAGLPFHILTYTRIALDKDPGFVSNLQAISEKILRSIREEKALEERDFESMLCSTFLVRESLSRCDLPSRSGNAPTTNTLALLSGG